MSDRLVTAAAQVIVDASLCRRVRRGDWNTGEVTIQAAEEYAQALAKAGLLAPDLPEPDDPGIFVPDGKGWLPCGSDGPSVWTAPDSLIMVQRIEPGDLTPAQARHLAYALLAAANHAEKEDV